MKVIDVRPVGIVVEVEYNLEDLKKLKIALDNCEIEVSEKIEGSWEARDYVVNKLYPEIAKVIEDFKDAT